MAPKVKTPDAKPEDLSPSHMVKELTYDLSYGLAVF